MVIFKAKQYFLAGSTRMALYPIITAIAIVAVHSGLVERMRLHNAEAERSGSHVTEVSSLGPGSGS